MIPSGYSISSSHAKGIYRETTQSEENHGVHVFVSLLMSWIVTVDKLFEGSSTLPFKICSSLPGKFLLFFRYVTFLIPTEDSCQI